MKCPKCQTPIADHHANACLDALFIENIMKWKMIEMPGLNYPWTREIVWDTGGNGRLGLYEFNPSNNIAHAMEGMERHKKDIRVNLAWAGKEWVVQVWAKEDSTDWIGVYNISLELSLTRALILWVMEKDNQ